MEFVPTEIPDVVLVKPTLHRDGRGHFLESWSERVFADAGIEATFVQDNHSRSTRGSLRGLHYQTPRAQGKLVRVVTGRIWDVAVDLRSSSPTFGRWVGRWLSDEGHDMLWIPPGFAHGFYVTSDVADFVYKCTDYYSPENEHTLRWDDPEVGVEWPLVDGAPPKLSPKDRRGVGIRDAKVFP